jgi:hypothetical protein
MSEINKCVNFSICEASARVCVYPVIDHFFLRKFLNITHISGQRCGVRSRISPASAKRLLTPVVGCYYGHKWASAYISGFGS